MLKLRNVFATSAVLAVALAAGTARPAHAAVTLTQTLVDGQVLPHVQALANNDAPPPGLTLSGDPVAPSFAALDPTGDAWGADQNVRVQNQGGTWLVEAAFDGVVSLYTVQATDK